MLLFRLLLFILNLANSKSILFQGRATVVVAHRLSTIRDADKIVVLENGRVVEEGSHEELIKIEGGKYRYLVDLQFSEESGEVDVIMSEVDLNEVTESPNSKPKLRKQSKNIFSDY